jgi:hypothetical protein
MKLTFVRLLVDDFPACFRFVELNQPIPMTEAAA